MVQYKIVGNNLKQQVDRMVARSNSVLYPLKVGDTVLLIIPSVDRGRRDAVNLLSKIIKEKNDIFCVTTYGGVLKIWLERSLLVIDK